MASFLEEKLAALDAAQRARKRMRLAVIAGVALLVAVPATGLSWLAAPAVLALLLALLWYSVALKLTGRLKSASGAAERPTPPRTEKSQSAHAGPEPAGPMTGDWYSLELSVPAALELPTDSGAELALAAGPRDVSFRFSFAPEREDRASNSLDYPVCELRLRDDDGGWWQGSTYFEPLALTRPLEAGAGEIHFWRDVPGAWREALQTTCLISGVTSLIDSRERIELPVGDGSVTIMFKNQGPEIDVGWLDRERRLVVRVAKMHYEVWKDGEFEDIVDGVTFGYLLEPEELLLPTSPEAHWSEWGAWEEDRGGERPLPVLSRVTS